MSCLEDRKNIRKFLEDLLEESEYQRVRRHVETCGVCAQFVRAAGSISSMLMELGRAAAPDDLPEAVLYRYDLKRRAAAVPSPEPSAAPAASFAAVSEPAVTVSRSTAVSGWLKFVVALLVFLVAGLAWRDWVQTRLLEELLEKKSSSAESGDRLYSIEYQES